MCYVVHPLKSGQDLTLYGATLEELVLFACLLGSEVLPHTLCVYIPPPDCFFLNQYVKDLLFSFVLQI